MTELSEIAAANAGSSRVIIGNYPVMVYAEDLEI